MNNCSFTGRLTAKPELKTTQNGKSVCSFTLAVERKFKGTDGKPITDFIDFVAWEHNANFICKWFDKGIRIAITGELQTRMYEKDGKKIKVSEVLVNSVEFADGKATSSAKTETNTQPQPQQNNSTSFDSNDDFISVDEDDGKLPF